MKDHWKKRLDHRSLEGAGLSFWALSRRASPVPEPCQASQTGDAVGGSCAAGPETGKASFGRRAGKCGGMSLGKMSARARPEVMTEIEKKSKSSEHESECRI